MRHRASVLVGRDAERAAIRGALHDAQARKGGAVLVTGPSGIGKTRLAAEAASEATAIGMCLMQGRGSPLDTSTPLRPLIEAVLSYLRDGPMSDEPLRPYLPALGQFIPGLADGPNVTRSYSSVVLAEAVLRLTACAGSGRGTLLALDDLHDADVETLAIVEYVIDNLHRQPVVLVGAMRSQDCAALELARAAVRRRTCQLLELDRLSRSDLLHLIGSCLQVPPTEVPESIVDLVWTETEGNPLGAEDLIGRLISTGALVSTTDGWRLLGSPPAVTEASPPTDVELSMDMTTALAAGAMFGQRFPLAVVRAVAGVDGDALLRTLATSDLIAFQESEPGWCSFRDPRVAEAILAGLTPIQRARIAGRTADIVETLHPGLPGPWCQQVAKLRADAGANGAAGRLFLEAGRRSLVAGAVDAAAKLLDQACLLLADDPDVNVRVQAVTSLLEALTEAGQGERALAVAETLDLVPADARGAVLHAQLARIASAAGRWRDSLRQISTATTQLGLEASDTDSAAVDAVRAHLMLTAPGGNQLEEAESLARSTASRAERAGRPDLACEALGLLGTMLRGQDILESNACFERMLELADRHGRPLLRLHALGRLGLNDALLDGCLQRLTTIYHEAGRVGAVRVTNEVGAALALQSVLHGDFTEAAAILDRPCAEASGRKIADTAQDVALTRAVIAAHRGQRRQLECALAEFRHRGGHRSPRAPLASGLARAVCALLEEDVARARIDLAHAVAAADHPATLHLAGRHGLYLLLQTLAGEADTTASHEAAATAAGQFRWNRQFLLLGKAVLLGQAGERHEAEVVLVEALDAAAVYPVAQHLGLRLVAEAALRDGWGHPVSWLRTAEDYFHRLPAPAVAAACRALLRQSGATVLQRREGCERIPYALRSLGITVREYEIFGLLTDRLGNRIIARRLHLSPRTVEKHVASLMAKTGQPNREALSQYALTMLAGSGP